MDGNFHEPVPADGLDGRPFLMLGTDDSTHRPGGTDPTWGQVWNRLDGWKRWLTVSGADHFSFTDGPVLLEQSGLPPAVPEPGQTPLTAGRAVAVTRAYVGAFFDLHLRHIPQPLLNGPSPANPEVRFNDPARVPTTAAGR